MHCPLTNVTYRDTCIHCTQTDEGPLHVLQACMSITHPFQQVSSHTWAKLCKVRLCKDGIEPQTKHDDQQRRGELRHGCLAERLALLLRLHHHRVIIRQVLIYLVLEAWPNEEDEADEEASNETPCNIIIITCMITIQHSYRSLVDAASTSTVHALTQMREVVH